jgi:hypothetical protein
MQQRGQLHQAALNPVLSVPISMDWNGDADWTSSLGLDMMAAVDTAQTPSIRFEHPGALFAGELLHNASSITRSSACVDGASTGTDKHPSMASRRLARSSSIVSPSVAQPGMDGTFGPEPTFFGFVHDGLNLHKKWWRRRELKQRQGMILKDLITWR